MVSEVAIPVMDQTTESVALTGWLKQEGDSVQSGEAVCEIETDKATVEITAPAAGRLRKILVAAGTQVPPRTVVALVADPDEPLPQIDPYYRLAPSGALSRQTAPSPAPAAAQRPAAARVAISPRARRLAEQHQLDLTTLAGSGPGGRIQEEDVQRALSAAPAAPPAAERAARAKAERVARSWHTIPHFYTTLTVDLTAVAAARAAGPRDVTFTDYFAHALARTLPDHPALNGFWDEQRQAVQVVPELRLGLVVETEHGLVIPTLADLRGRTLDQIAHERAQAVAQARAGQLRAEALAGATFTLSNVGPGHIDHFTAIINPPQVAILSAGSVSPRPVAAGDAVVVRPVVTFTLGADHRAVDGRQAARFLEQFQRALEAPA